MTKTTELRNGEQKERKKPGRVPTSCAECRRCVLNDFSQQTTYLTNPFVNCNPSLGSFVESDSNFAVIARSAVMFFMSH